MKNTQNPITEVTIENELDIVLAYKKAMRLAEVTGLSFTDQTKFTTAVSEVCRNVLVHADKGKAIFYITNEGTDYFVETVIVDQGPGIKDVENLLNPKNTQAKNSKTGIINCQKLSDVFELESTEGEGTQVRIGKRLPAHHPPINDIILSGWRKHFSALSPVSPYDELKKQNHRLLQTLDELKVQKTQTQEQLEEIKTLNKQLEGNYEQIKQLSEDVEKQNHLLKKRNEELDEFAHIVSHDLKSPIRNLQSLLQIMESTPVDKQENIKKMFVLQLQKMEGLIDSILSYSRAGHEEIEKKAVNLNQLLTELVNDLQRPENFSFEFEENLPVIFTEEIFIFQIFINLLTNAVKYNDKPEGCVKIGFSQLAGEESYFYVDDNGPGIPSAKREKVFKMFAILQKIQGVDSTGLGLAIIKKIINQNGGEIWIQDSEFYETGSRFCFTWPAAVVATS